MTEQRKAPHPIVYMFLIIPFGATSGYLAVTMGYLARGGLSLGEVASLVAWGLLPHTFKALWAPVIDLTLSRKRWYMIGSVTTALLLFALSIIPLTSDRFVLLSVVAFLMNFAVTVLGMAVDGLMAYNTDDHTKGKAAGWFQAGNLGGNGLGGGLGLLLAQHLEASWLPGALVALTMIASAAPLVIVPDAPKVGEATQRIGQIILEALKDIWRVLSSRQGIVGITMCILPMGTGAASGLFSRIADEWHASESTVELATGTMGGLVSAIGCLAGGAVLDRMNRRLAYALGGLIMAVIATAMALVPRTDTQYFVWVLVYNFGNGLVYAAFSGFVLEAIGRGAAATKYNIFASVSNMPIWYMTVVLGWVAGGHEGHATGRVMWTEAGTSVLAIVLLLGLVILLRSIPVSEATADAPSPRRSAA
jgi:MFS family permease